MSWEAWGTPEDPQPVTCELCDDDLGTTPGCKLCEATNRADKAEADHYQLRQVLAHRLRILKTRKVYANGNKAEGISVEMLMAMTLLQGIPGVLLPHEVEPRMVAEAEKALLTFDNGHLMFSTQPGCNCHFNDKPHPAIHAESCPYRIRYAAVYEAAKATGSRS